MAGRCTGISIYIYLDVCAIYICLNMYVLGCIGVDMGVGAGVSVGV